MLGQANTGSFTLLKVPTGIAGFDEITEGGLPKSRSTLVCGGPGSGKTLFAMEFLVRGIQEYNESGVFVSFEETREELTQNFASLGFDLNGLTQQNKLTIDYVHIDFDDVAQTGNYDLDGLLIRLENAINKVHAKRVVLDTIEVLFTFLGDSDILRGELRRLFRWLKEKDVTVIITGESGDGVLTRRGIEAYISDCVLFLDQRVEKQIARRRLRIVKYRGSKHGMDEYPFLIDENGFVILPITSVGLTYPVSDERISTGIARLDAMLGGRGLFVSSTILLSGPSGTGKTSFASQFVAAACQRGERALYFSFEESANQIIRNMRSVGMDLQPWVDSNLLRFNSARPTMYSIEMHLSTMHKYVETFQPQIVVIDPITNFDSIGSTEDSRLLLTRVIDFLKMKHITTLLTSLTRAGEASEQTEVNISSLVDTWILVNNLETNGERNRILSVLKSRGMEHSNQISEFEITPRGIQLIDAYWGNSGVLTGSARLAQEAREYDTQLAHQHAIELKKLQFERKRASIKAQINNLEAELAIENAETQLMIDLETRQQDASRKYADIIARKRGSRSSDTQS